MISRIARIKSDFLKYTVYRIYDMKSRLIILCICGVLGFPTAMFATALRFHEQAQRAASNFQTARNEGLEMFIVVCYSLAGLAVVVIGLLVYTSGVNCFDYYNRRENTDKSWSLPLKNRSRFWGDFLSGIGPVAFVYIVSAAAGLVIMALGFPKRTFEETPELFSIVIAAMFAGLLTLISVYIIVVFCAAMCGRVYESVVYPVLIMGIIPALIALFGTMLFVDVWQVYIYDQMNTVLAGTSPGGFLACFLYELTQYRVGPGTPPLSDYLTFLNPSIIIPFILVNAGFLTAAFYIGKRRGAEKTGQAFVVKYALEVILSFVVFCITAVFCMGISQSELTFGIVFALVVCTLVAFLLLDVSAKRGFKKMGKSFLKYAVMLVCSVIVSNVMLMADGFGIGRYVPPLEKVESVNINVDFLDSGINFLNTGYHRAFYHLDVKFRSPEVIGLVRELNIESNNSLGGKRWFSSNGVGMMSEVTYTMKNGNTVRRNVNLNNREQFQRLLPLVVDDDYKNAQLARIDNTINSWEIIREEPPKVTSLTGVFLYRKNSASNNDAHRLYEAFKADYKAETFEQRFNSAGSVNAVITLAFSEAVLEPGSRDYTPRNRSTVSFHVLPHYVNVLAELERQGYDINAPSDYYEPHITDIAITRCDYIGGNDMTSSTGGSINDTLHFTGENSSEQVSELIKILLDVAKPSHIVDGPGYMISILGTQHNLYTSYIIPPEYNDIAEELYEILQRIEETSEREALSTEYNVLYDIIDESLEYSA